MSMRLTLPSSAHGRERRIPPPWNRGAVGGIYAFDGRRRAGCLADIRALLIAVATLCVGLVLIEAVLWMRLRNGACPSAASATAPAPGTPVRTSALGFRERDFDAEAIRSYRVMVVGDSLTFGVGLAPRAPRARGRCCGSALQHDIEVLNFGVSMSASTPRITATPCNGSPPWWIPI
jgi:hypothetical protein